MSGLLAVSILDFFGEGDFTLLGPFLTLTFLACSMLSSSAGLSITIAAGDSSVVLSSSMSKGGKQGKRLKRAVVSRFCLYLSFLQVSDM